jgi:uncharacterized protein YwgA
MLSTDKDVSKPTRHELLLLLLGLGQKGTSTAGVSGITRLQKLLFLTWKEGGVDLIGDAFDFKPYKAGPYSRKLYDELEFLENIGLVQSEIEGEASEVEAAEIEEISFEQLMGDDADPFVDIPSQAEAMTADAYEGRKFTLTERGLEEVHKIISSGKGSAAETGIRRIKSKFGNFSLQDLLYHVYTKYESQGWTSESEIRDKVLARGGRR